MSEEYVEENFENRGERQKAYRKKMADQGLKAKQFWVPEADVSKVEAFILDLRNKYRGKPEVLEDDLDDLI